jgi:NADH-quinone oxidoreductase subunit C
MSTDPSPPTLNQDVVDLLRQAVGSDAFSTQEFVDNFRIYVNKSRLIDALSALKSAGFSLLSELGGTDYLKYPGKSGTGKRFEVHYVLRNLDANRMLVVKAGVDASEPVLPTATGLWQGADWMEREVFDMFGIRFDGHPDLRRILMPEEFTAWPLRKDYPLRGRGERHNFPRITRAQS